jgi:hypothetical protein
MQIGIDSFAELLENANGVGGTENRDGAGVFGTGEQRALSRGTPPGDGDSRPHLPGPR